MRLAFAMVLGAGTALCPAGSWASTGPHGYQASTAVPASGHASGKAARSQLQEALADGIPEQQVGIAFGHPACLQGIAGDEYADTHAAEKPCINSTDLRKPFRIQLGRRIGTRADILGEFDGVRVDYRLGDGLILNGIAGYPVLAAEDIFNPDRQVFGLSATADRPDHTWELNGYLYEQQANGQVSGRSMGGAIRHLKAGRSMLVYLDYDPDTSSVSTLLASGALKLPFNTTLSATLDLQSRSIPGPQKQYLTHSMTVMDGWEWILPDDRLAHHIGNGASEVDMLAVDLSYALSRRIKLRGDVILLNVDNGSGAAARSGLSEYYYHLKITGKDLMVPGDRSKLDLRRSVTDAGQTYTASFDTKHAVKRFWNFISQLRADYHTSADAGGSGWAASPKVKMEYRPSKQFGFHIEAGSNLSKGENVNVKDSRSSYFVSLGYQAKF